jgi:hypothetical protein
MNRKPPRRAVPKCPGSHQGPERVDGVLRSGECPACGLRFRLEELAYHAGRYGGGTFHKQSAVPLLVPTHTAIPSYPRG